MPTTAFGPSVRIVDDAGGRAVCDPEYGGKAPFHKMALNVALFQPEIPQNAGNIARTCAATHTHLHFIEPLGFRLTDRYLKRAGLDYWPHVRLSVHSDLDAFRFKLGNSRWIYLSARSSIPYHQFQFQAGDCLLFGPETRGLPPDLLESAPPEHVLQIPIDRNRVRSLNLSTSVGIVLYEALRQLHLNG